MTDSFKLRTFSGWSILLLGVLLLVTSFLPVVLGGSVSPVAGMIGLFGLLAVGVGIPLSIATAPRLAAGAARNLCIGLESLILGAAGGLVGFFVQPTAFSNRLYPFHVTLVLELVALFCFAVLARVAAARQGSAAFRSSQESLFSLGGCMGPTLCLVLQPSLLVFAAIAAGLIAAQAESSREGSLVALALIPASLPVFVRAEAALCLKRWRDTTAAWPSYGVLVWAALLGWVAFQEVFQWLTSLGSVPFRSSPLPAWPHISLDRVLCYSVSLAACISCYMASRRVRRALPWRVLGYVAFGLGSLLPVSVGLASDNAHQGSPLPIATLIAVLIVLPAAFIIGAHHLLFRRDEKLAVLRPQETCLAVTSLSAG